MTLALLLLVVKPFQFVDDSKHLAVSALVVLLGAGGLAVSGISVRCFACRISGAIDLSKNKCLIISCWLQMTYKYYVVASFQGPFAPQRPPPHAACLVAVNI